MDEIKETLAILKSRWSEAALILEVGVLSAFLTGRFRVGRSNLTKMQLLLYLAYALVFMVVYTILNCGFMRTVYLEEKKQQSLMVLLKTGRCFFARIYGFWLLLMLAYIPLFGSILFLIKPLVSEYAGNLLIYQLSITSASIILIKPLLLMPALIIVTDCRIFESLKSLKQCRLLHAKQLIALFSVQMILPFLWIFLRVPYGAETISQGMLTIVPTAITYLIGLMVAVMAVRFVASLDLVYDSQPASIDFEGLRR